MDLAGAGDWYPLRGAQFPGVSPVLRGSSTRSGEAAGPSISGRHAGARCRADLERLSGEDGAGLGIAFLAVPPTSREPRVSTLFEAQQKGNRCGESRTAYLLATGRRGRDQQNVN
jgi:hypothetical protein